VVRVELGDDKVPDETTILPLGTNRCEKSNRPRSTPFASKR
jgi:hypothetical protein